MKSFRQVFLVFLLIAITTITLLIVQSINLTSMSAMLDVLVSIMGIPQIYIPQIEVLLYLVGSLILLLFILYIISLTKFLVLRPINWSILSYSVESLYEKYNEGKKKNEDVQQYLNTLLDSIIVTATYLILLSIFGGTIVYFAHFKYGLSFYISITLFINLLIIEGVLVSYNPPIKYETSYIQKRPNSVPTLGIILALPFVFVYKLAQLRNPKIFSWYEIKTLCAYIRYILTNPAWLRDKDNRSDPFGGFSGIVMHRKEIKSPIKWPAGSMPESV